MMVCKKRFLFLLCFSFFIGCYNNAHIQTQRELKKGESSTNISVIVPAYNSDERFETLIAAQRIEFSHLKGYQNFELGYYGGLGSNIEEFFPWALGGFIWRKNINNNFLPLKMGLHAEYGQLKIEETRGVNEHRKYSGFQIRPSITTLTSSKKRNYWGAHALLSISKRTEDHWYYDLINTESGSKYEEIKTVEQRNCNTSGFGLTAGWEIFSKSFSVQTQLDISMIKNAWEDFTWRESKPEIGYTLSPLVSLSAGINFFNPKRKTNQAFIPLPNVELNVIAIDDELVIDESESYSFIESSPKSYNFTEKLDQKRELEEAYNPYELARKHMKEPTVHKFLTFMSPFITSLGFFTTAFQTMDSKKSYSPLSYAYPFFGIVPYILSERIAKNSRWLEDKSKNTMYKKMYVEELRRLRYSKTIKYLGIITVVGILPAGLLLSDPW